MTPLVINSLGYWDTHTHTHACTHTHTHAHTRTHTHTQTCIPTIHTGWHVPGLKITSSYVNVTLTAKPTDEVNIFNIVY